MSKLRPYQQTAHDLTIKEWEDKISTAVVLPTGCGKTVVFAHIIASRRSSRSLVIAHREELIWQARDKIERFTGLQCGIEMGELYANGSLFGETNVIVSTVQTLNSKWGDRFRMGRFKPTDFDTLICDECHHATSPSYRRVFDYFKQNPNLKILGVTATPDRSDEEALGQVFESVAFDYEILDAIHDGWLVPVMQQFVSIGGLDFADVRTTAGDLNGADLAKLMEAEKNMQGVTGASIDIIGNRRAIVFTVSVKQAEQGAEIFNRHKPGAAEWVCGMTPKDRRREMLDSFRSGKIQVMFNCGVLTEGFDDAGVEVIIMARPTKSRSLYAQMCGRGLRPVDGLVDPLEEGGERKAAISSSAKPNCLIVDFVGNSGKHKLMTSADILGGKVSDKAMERAVIKAKQSGSPVLMSAALDEEEAALKAEIEAARKAVEARRHRVVAKVSFSSKTINPFDAFDMEPVKQRGWDSDKVLTEKQAAMLTRHGINPDTLNYSQGRQVISEMFRRWDRKLCTIKQASLLKRFGYETKDMKLDEASRIITQIRNRGWKKPVEV